MLLLHLPHMCHALRIYEAQTSCVSQFPHGVQQSLNQGTSFFNSPCPPPTVLGQLTGGGARQYLGLCWNMPPMSHEVEDIKTCFLLANSELGFSCYISILNSSKNSLGVLLRNMNKDLNKSHVNSLYKLVGPMQICDLFSFRNLPEMVANMK